MITTIAELNEMIAKGYNTLPLPQWNSYLSDNAEGWTEITETFGSDGSGSDFSYANHLYFIENYGAHRDVFFVNGSMDTYGVIWNENTDDEELKSIVYSLLEFPVIDNSILADVHAELIQCAWDSYARRAFEKELENRFEVWSIDISEENLKKEFETARVEAGEEWYSRYNSMDIDIEKVAAAVERNRFLAEYVTEITI